MAALEPVRVHRVELPDMNTDIIADIVTFWLSDSRDSPDRASARRGWWYQGGPVVDEEIRARFADLVPRALAGELMGWRATPDGALALILLLDQFTRNLYRGAVEAYAGDACAFEIVTQDIERGLDRALHPVARIWLYHPFHHCEDVAEQDRGLGLLRALRRDADRAWHGYWRGASRAGHATATSSPASAGSRIETPCSVATARRKNRHTWRRAARASVRGCTQATRPADRHIRFCTTAPSVVPALRERIIEPGRRRLAFVFRQGRMDFRSNSSRKPVTRSRMQRLGDSGKADVGSCLPRAVQEAASSAIRLLSTFSKR